MVNDNLLKSYPIAPKNYEDFLLRKDNRPIVLGADRGTPAPGMGRFSNFKVCEVALIA